jgi:hypothetical protein
MHRAGKATRFGEIPGGRQQHRRVSVMSAGMHFSGKLGTVRQTRLLVDIECIDVGPQGDRP